MIFHPSRVESELLHKYIEQSFVELTLLPAGHREDVRLLALLHAPFLSAHQIERRQRGVEMKIEGRVLCHNDGFLPRVREAEAIRYNFTRSCLSQLRLA